jgi:hypothetical protein
MGCASTVAVVVPSPAMSEVLEATSLNHGKRVRPPALPGCHGVVR